MHRIKKSEENGLKKALNFLFNNGWGFHFVQEGNEILFLLMRAGERESSELIWLGLYIINIVSQHIIII